MPPSRPPEQHRCEQPPDVEREQQPAGRPAASPADADRLAALLDLAARPRPTASRVPSRNTTHGPFGRQRRRRAGYSKPPLWQRCGDPSGLEEAGAGPEGDPTRRRASLLLLPLVLPLHLPCDPQQMIECEA